MVKEHTVERLEKSAAKLSITIGKDDVRSEYDDLVAKYAKSAQIKGFRKGHVPRNVLERKFGDVFRAETLQNILDAGLREVLEQIDEQPLAYSQPSLQDEDLELDPDADLSFSVVYDVFPAFELGEYKELTITESRVKITAADEDRELEQLRAQNALVVEKEGGAVASGDIVTVDFVEVDEDGSEIEETRRQDFTFTVGQGHNIYHIADEIVGASTGETRTVEKTYPEDFEHEELAGTTKKIAVTVKTIKQRDVPDLDDEFAQDISDDFETLDDLRADVRSRLEKRAAERIRQLKIEQVMDTALESTEIDLPESMITGELDSSWRAFAQQYRATEEQMEQLLTLQNKTKEELYAEWRPNAEKRLKRSLIVQAMVEKEEIEVSEEEAEAKIRADAEERNQDPDQVLEFYKQNRMVSYVQQEEAERKLFDHLFEGYTINKGKAVPFVDLMEEKQ